eukprot:1178807-Prymnesium_polylepis.1
MHKGSTKGSKKEEQRAAQEGKLGRDGNEVQDNDNHIEWHSEEIVDGGANRLGYDLWAWVREGATRSQGDVNRVGYR